MRFMNLPFRSLLTAVITIPIQLLTAGEIAVDGSFGDWNQYGTVMEDAAGDNVPGEIDFRFLGGDVSPRGITVYIETALPFDIEDSALRIYIDADANTGTGLRIGNIGAEFSYDFLSDESTLFPLGTTLRRREAIAAILPVGRRAQYEVAFPLSVFPDVQPGGNVRIFVSDANTGDRVPDIGNTFSVPVPYSLFVEPEFENFDKADPSDIRVATWNVLYDGPLVPNQEDGFGRLLQATVPDIINFQEMWDADNDWLKAFMDKWLPLDEGQWHVAKRNDCMTASRFPILNQWIEDGNLIVWIDTSSVWSFDSVFVNAHTPCCEDQDGRMEESDNFMLALRRMIRQQDAFARGKEFCIFVTGDLNANTTTPEIITAQNGILTTPALQALSFSPDPYGRPLVDAAPRLTHYNRLYTWRNQTQTSSTNRIDYILYQESRLRKKRSFVCETILMPPGFRSDHNLERNDALVSDHLLVVADFSRRDLDLSWSIQASFNQDWSESGWFGWLYHRNSPYLYSPEHGYFYESGRATGVWCWDPYLGWWFTGEGLFPFVYSQDHAAWLLFRSSESGSRRYFNLGTQADISVPRWGD